MHWKYQLVGRQTADSQWQKVKNITAAMKTWILLRSAEVTNDDDGNDTNDDDHCLGIVSTLSCPVTSLASSCRPGSHRAPCICRQYARHPALRLWLLRLQRTHRNSDDVTLAPPRPGRVRWAGQSLEDGVAQSWSWHQFFLAFIVIWSLISCVSWILITGYTRLP